MRFRIDTFSITVKKEERKILRTRGGFTGYHPKYYVIVGKKTRRPTRYEYKKIYKKLKERREAEKQGEPLLVNQKKKEDKMKIYKGMRLIPELKTASDVKVSVEEEGKKETLLRHHVHHSPTGFCWGYGGSGPSDLARSILWDYLGKEPSSDLYQDFKWEFVATWKAKWQITSTEIEEWIKGKFGEDYFDYLTGIDKADPRD